MSYQNIFQRYELKYLITQEQLQKLKAFMHPFMKGDAYGRSTICNIYFDTPNYLLIRRSLEKPVYKEKLRLRSYGTATKNSTVFVELKKKYQSVVYKRRLPMLYNDAVRYLYERESIENPTQIIREIDYFWDFYRELKPAVFLSYEREAFYARDNADFRITFDQNLLFRTEDLSLASGAYGTPILPGGYTLMEIKAAGALPLWITRFLSENRIFKTSFSKYGTAYEILTGGTYHVDQLISRAV